MVMRVVLYCNCRGGQVISLVPKGSCDGPDGRPVRR